MSTRQSGLGVLKLRASLNRKHNTARSRIRSRKSKPNSFRTPGFNGITKSQRNGQHLHGPASNAASTWFGRRQRIMAINAYRKAAGSQSILPTRSSAMLIDEPNKSSVDAKVSSVVKQRQMKNVKKNVKIKKTTPSERYKPARKLKRQNTPYCGKSKRPQNVKKSNKSAQPATTTSTKSETSSELIFSSTEQTNVQDQQLGQQFTHWLSFPCFNNQSILTEQCEMETQETQRSEMLTAKTLQKVVQTAIDRQAQAKRLEGERETAKRAVEQRPFKEAELRRQRAIAANNRFTVLSQNLSNYQKQTLISKVLSRKAPEKEELNETSNSNVKSTHGVELKASSTEYNQTVSNEKAELPPTDEQSSSKNADPVALDGNTNSKSVFNQQTLNSKSQC